MTRTRETTESTGEKLPKCTGESKMTQNRASGALRFPQKRARIQA